ncbi:hypothetical protein J4573_20670 [Actinomadura barringtoniae]|uniref:Uncharacterized protein n=1 Tax=Actinomadura barringtoniae TaxID=1427535 RepID=A0A939T7Q6_9ACTN|nr:hypothetical protein [Actinomadura barringtoniae]MBO2449527.1 hypothetical protein [Actinomadura barringtoniae]
MNRPAEALLWWVALTAGYLGMVSTISLTEFVVGATGSAVGAAAAMGARRVLAAERTGASSVPPKALLWLPPQILGDTVRVLWSPQGDWGEMRMGQGRLGAVTLLVSVAPASYVGEADPESGRLVLHRVDGRPSALEKRLAGGT